MEGEDFFRDDKLSTGKLGTTAKLNKLHQDGLMTDEMLLDYKRIKNMTEKQILADIDSVLKNYH